MATAAANVAVSANRSVTIDGKKFLWDGRPFTAQDEASRAAEIYKKDNFEVQMVEVSGTYLLYTRRAVKEITVVAP